MIIYDALASCLLPTAVRSQLLPVEAPVATAPSPQAWWASTAAGTLQTTGLNFSVLHVPRFIVLTRTHTFYTVKHYKRARVSKAGSQTVQTTASQIFLSTVSENEKCSRLSLTAFSFKSDFSILSSPQASKK